MRVGVDGLGAAALRLVVRRSRLAAADGLAVSRQHERPVVAAEAFGQVDDRVATATGRHDALTAEDLVVAANGGGDVVGLVAAAGADGRRVGGDGHHVALATDVLGAVDLF